MPNGNNVLVTCPNCGYVSKGKGPATHHFNRCPATPHELAIMIGADDNDPNKCWLPTPKQGPDQRVRIGGKRAHIVMARLVLGPAPLNTVVCHTCDVGHCINPSHLWYGTRKDNQQDMSTKGRARNQYPAPDSTTKFCPGCKRVLPRSEFGKNKGQPDGLRGRCRPCANQQMREYNTRRRS